MKKKSKAPYKERRVYLFPCSNCGKKKAQSFKRSRAKRLVCRPCRSRAKQENPNQLNLFDKAHTAATNFAVEHIAKKLKNV